MSNKVERQPLAEHSFGLPSAQSLSGNSSVDGKEKESEATAKANISGSSDSEKASTQSSKPVMKRLKYEMCKNWREKG